MVNNNAAAVLLTLDGAGARQGSRRLARRADRDRRRVPHARHHDGRRRHAGRGRHHQPHARPQTTSGASDRAPALLMKVHTSPTTRSRASPRRSTKPTLAAHRARARRCRCVVDLGTGALVDLSRLRPADASRCRRNRSPPAPTSSRSRGDKLLGGPQAGLIVGRREAIAKHPQASAQARAARDQADAGRARGDAAHLCLAATDLPSACRLWRCSRARATTSARRASALEAPLRAMRWRRV